MQIGLVVLIHNGNAGYSESCCKMSLGYMWY